MPWTHETVYRALVDRDPKREHRLQSERYAELYQQQPNSAVLYAPGGKRTKSAPLHINETRNGFRPDVLEGISPAIEFVRRDNKGLGKDSQNFDWYRVVDWDRLAKALGL